MNNTFLSIIILLVFIISFTNANAQSGNCLDFDGNNDYVNLGNGTNFDIGNTLTIEAWVKPDNLSSRYGIFSTRSNNYAGSFQLEVGTGNNGTNRVAVTGVGTWVAQTNDNAIAAGEWTHIAYSRSGTGSGTHTIYINGVTQVLISDANYSFINNSSDKIIGSGRTDREFFPGKIDEVRIWNIARTQTQIQDNMNGLLTGCETGLAAYYRFDQGNSGQNNTNLPNELIDYVGCNKGTLNGFALDGSISNWGDTSTDKAPILATTIIENISPTSANVSGNIFSIGSDDVITRGICYSTNDCPTIEDDKAEEMGTFGSGTFTMNLTELTPDTEYYIRTYAINDQGISYGETKFYASNIPDTQAHSLTFDNIFSNQIDISWINGSGENRVVFVSAGSNGIANPVNNTTYTADVAFGSGDEIGDSGWYCVYNGGGNTVTVTRLSEDTTYRVMVCEYNQAPGFEVYNINSGMDNPSNQTTLPKFTNIDAGLTGVSNGSVAWGDYDNDGDLDILLTGFATDSFHTGRIYRNDGNDTFASTVLLPGLEYSSVAWGDYDNDGDLDILLTGENGPDNPISRVYRNDAGTFTNINAGLTGIESGSIAWGDYDNDGDLDIILTGENGPDNPISKIYRNDDGTFTDINAGLTGVESGSVAWGDYDNDGDLDILLTGDSSMGRTSKIYRNNSGYFEDISAMLMGVENSSAAWGDYDNDGDLDILLTGYTTNGRISKVYRNDEGTFVDINAGLQGVSSGSVAWGDYDNDGDLDILLTGYDGSGGRISKIYCNDTATFTNINAGLTSVYKSSAAWGDYDNDGDLDILLTGYLGYARISKVYRNNGSASNTAPAAPTNLQFSLSADSINFSWDASTDVQTPVSGLTYNLRVGLSSGGNEIFSAMAQSSGLRKIPALGSQNHNTQWQLSLDRFVWENSLRFQTSVFYWSVQAIDAGFMGSDFATENTFPIQYPELLNDMELLPDGTLAWETQRDYLDVISGYHIHIDDDPVFGSLEVDDVISLSGRDIDVYAGVQLNQLPNYDNLQDNTIYYWRMKPIYNDGVSSVFTIEEKSFFFNKENSAPNAPASGFTPAGDVAVGTLSPTVAWHYASDPDTSDNAELLNYILQVSDQNDFSSTTFIDTTTNNITAIEITSLSDAMRYYYRIKTVDDEGLESAWSATLQFRTNTALTVFAQPNRSPGGGQTQDFMVYGDCVSQVRWGIAGVVPTELDLLLAPGEEYFTLPQDAVTVQCYWSFDATGGSGWTATVRLYYDDSELNGIPESSLQMWKTDNSGVDWQNIPITARDIAENWVEGNVDSFSDFVLASGDAPLPIELTDFYAEIVSCGIEIHWTTVSEMDNAGFYLYRTTGDLPSFQNLASLIEGAGTTNEPHNYTYLDTNVQNGTLYRYKLSDINSETGMETFHPEIAVIAGQGMVDPDKPLPTKYALKQNLPNPFNPETIIEFEVPDGTRHAVSLRIYDSSGKLIRTLVDKDMEPGYHSIMWDGKDDNGNSVHSGVYFYKMVTEGYSKTRRCVMLK